MKLASTSFVAATVFCLVSAAVLALPVEWPVASGGNGHFYELVAGGASWTGAKTAAETRTYGGVSGHLVTYSSAAEDQWVCQTLAPSTACWVGLHQAGGSPEPAGGWSWVTGEPVSYTNWWPGEPNNSSAGENSAAINTFGTGYLWNDMPEGYSMAYIAEFDTSEQPPEPPPSGVLFFDLAADWSNVQNPNGPWSLKKSPSALFEIVQPDLWSDAMGQQAWADESFNQTAHVPFWMKTIQAPPLSVLYTYGVQVGDLLAHGAELDRTGSAVTSAVWTSPSNGATNISGAVWSVTTFGRTMRWELRKNGVTFSSGDIVSNGTYSRAQPFAFTSGSGGAAVLQQTVAVGDQIELLLQSISEGGNMSDMLGVSLHVALTPDESPPPPQTGVLFFDDFEDGPDPSWLQPHGGWVWENGHMRNTTTCGDQRCMPDIWAGGATYTDYMASADICMISSSSGNGTSLYFYTMGAVPAEHAEGQTSAYAVDAGYSYDGTPAQSKGSLARLLPWPDGFGLALATQNPAFFFTPGTVYRVKFGRVGNEVLYKKWPKADPEPSEWLLRATDTTLHAGYWGISFWNGIGWIDNVLVEAAQVPVSNYATVSAELAEPGRCEVRWRLQAAVASENDFRVWRSVERSPFTPYADGQIASGQGGWTLIDRGVEPGRDYAYRIGLMEGAAETLLFETSRLHVPDMALRLYPAAPNPFNPRTTIRFDLPAAGPVRLAIYDVAGRLVRVLVEGEIPAGSHEAVWDGRDQSGRSAPSGSYLARLVAGGKVEGVRLSLVR
jgi:hypothetical protein